jgi:mannose-1-phosphate guanylyltransferase/mannose-6-phosphate isomerase
MMIIVIIAGGSGTRLWPLSTPDRPKHLLKLTGEHTMLQAAYERASKLSDTIYVVTEASHSDRVREQLPELSKDAFLVEPGRRGTAHCIVLALDFIARKHDQNEPIAFIHSDHHIRDISGFINSFVSAAKISQTNNEITLIGIEPTFPSTAFGYIKRDGSIDDTRGVFNVESFKEKPDYETAKKYVESGSYLWNCGYFVGSVNTFLDEMKLSAPNLRKDYKSLSSISNLESKKYEDTYLCFDIKVIDIALIEKAKNLAVVSANFDWMDIGSFKDLHDVVSQDREGNYLSGKNIHTIDVDNIYVRNEEDDKPIAVIGLNNVVIVNTPDGILVSRKDVSHRTGEVAKKLQK